MSFPHTRWPPQNPIGRFVHEPQRAQFPHLRFVNRRLEGEGERIESLYLPQVGQLQSHLEIARAARIGFPTHGLQQEVGVSRLLLGSAFQQGFPTRIEGGQVERGQCSSQAFERTPREPPIARLS